MAHGGSTNPRGQGGQIRCVLLLLGAHNSGGLLLLHDHQMQRERAHADVDGQI